MAANTDGEVYSTGPATGSLAERLSGPTLDEDDDIVCTEASNSDVTSAKGQRGLVPWALGLLRGAASAAGDLTRLQLPPQLNMPKSQLQLYCEAIYACEPALLTDCTDGDTPLARLLAVTAWHLSTIRLPPFGKAPFNPIEGETHHVSAGGLHVLAEQVSHHPPISAVYAAHPEKRIRTLWQIQPVPRFNGRAVDITINGFRRLFLDAHDETYELGTPNLSFRLLPSPLPQRTGFTTIVCPKGGLFAWVDFKAKGPFGWGRKGQAVNGAVGRLGPNGEMREEDEMLDLEGHWDDKVYYWPKHRPYDRSLLYDCHAALRGLHAPQVANKSSVSPTESCRVWASVSKAVLAGDWEVARDAKKDVEERQRRSRAERERAAAVFTPAYFERNGHGECSWKGPALESLGTAPLVY